MFFFISYIIFNYLNIITANISAPRRIEVPVDLSTIISLLHGIISLKGP